MTTAPTYSITLDHVSNRLQHDTSSIRPIPLIDDHNPYYPDPDYGFDPYWDTQSYDQHHLYFYHNFDKPTHVIESDSHGPDKALKTILTNARVDPWEHICHFTRHPTQSDPENEINRGGPHVSLATAVAARFVNTLVTRSRERDNVPSTTYLGLKYKLRMF